MLVNSVRAIRIGSFIALGFFLFAADQRAEAQGRVSRPAMPARPNVTMPQAHNTTPVGTQYRTLPFGNAGNLSGFNNNNAFQNNMGFQGNFGYSPFNGWNYADMNAWNNLNMTGWPYWNTVANINPFNPAQNFVWSQPTMPGWNANPFIMNAAYNNMFNNFNMMNGGMNAFGMMNGGMNAFGMMNGGMMNGGMNAFGMMGNAMQVGNWNAFNMPMNNWNGMNQGMGNWGFNPAMLMNLNPNNGAAQR